MLHGDPRVARETRLFGVHLPAGGDVRAARAALGPAAWVSASAHSFDEVLAAAAAGVDAVTLSPVFASESKPGYGPALGLEALAESARRSPVPIIALGGIMDGSRLRACLEAGASGVAVMGVIMRAANPAATMVDLITATFCSFPLVLQREAASSASWMAVGAQAQDPAPVAAGCSARLSLAKRARRATPR